MSLKLLLAVSAALCLLAGQALPAEGATSRSNGRSAVVRPTSPSGAASARLRKPRLPLRIHSTAKPTAPHLLTPSAIGLVSLNKPGLSIADNPFGITPPDSTGSIGPSNYVEMVNSVIAVYKRSDLSQVSKATFDAWLSTGAPLCDPQIQWDSSAQRWLFVVLDCNFGDDQFLFGWSMGASPSPLSTSGWCVFSEPTPGVLSDYPKLGHNSSYMLVGTNDFDDSTFSFTTAQIFWMPTPAIGDTSCNPPTVNSAGTAATPLTNGDGVTLTGTPVPVNTTTNATDGYVVSAYDPSGPPPTPQTKLALWHLDSGGVLHQDPDLTVNSYAVPGPAPDLNGSSFRLDTLDGRLMQAVGDPTTGIYTQHTVNGPGNRSKVTWYEIQVAASVPSLTQEGDIASATDFVFDGAISPRADGKGAAIFYNRSSATIDPVIAGQVRTTSTPSGQMDPGEIVLATSLVGDTDFSCGNGGPVPCRWGDYSGASPDPMNPNMVWGSNQFLATTNNPNWATENFAIIVPASRTAAQSGVPPAPGSRSANQSGIPPPPPPR